MRMSRSVVSAFLALALVAMLQSFMIIGPGADILEGDAGSAIEVTGASDSFEFIRDDGPIMERIPAPYVVFTVLAGGCVAIIAFYLFVRLSDDGTLS